MSFCGVPTLAIPWFEGFLGVGLLEFTPTPSRGEATPSDSSRKPSADRLFSAGKISSSLSRRFLRHSLAQMRFKAGLTSGGDNYDRLLAGGKK